MPTDTLTYSPTLPWATGPNDGSYGTCMTCVFDLTGGTSTGRQALAEALARMLITDQGTLLPVGPQDPISPMYGYNLIDHVNGRVRARDLSEISANVINQFRLDDRVLDAECSVQFFGGVLTIFATVYDREGPFPLTLAVNAVTIQILSLQGQT